MRVWPEDSGGGTGIATGVTGIASVTRPRGEWTGRRYSLTRLLREQRGLGVFLYPGVKGGVFLPGMLGRHRRGTMMSPQRVVFVV